MGYPQLVLIFWGTEYWTDGPPSTSIRLQQFLSSILPSPYFGMLDQYNVNTATVQQVVGIGYQGGAATLSEGDIQNQLESWMDLALIPIVDDNNTDLLYVLLPPSAVTLTVNGFSQNDPNQGFCGYHHHSKHNKIFGKDNLFFAVATSGLDFDTLTTTLSHELVEAFTDRSNAGWFSDDISIWPFPAAGRELGDICNCCNPDQCPRVTLNGFALASYWLQSQGRCMQQDDLTVTLVGVPDVVGDSPVAAAQALQAANLFMNVAQVTPDSGVNAPTVASQIPAAFAEVRPDSTVNVTVLTPLPNQAIVPDVRGSSPQDAQQTLQNNGLQMKVIKTLHSETAADVTVVDEDPPPETSVAVGTTVDVTLLAPKGRGV
jgi:hypothetical protein